MSAEKHWVDDDHYVEVSDDGKTSWKFEAADGPLDSNKIVEITDHYADGTSQSYEYSGSGYATFFNGGRGRPK